MNIRSQVIGGVQWMFSGTLVVTIIQTVQNVLLAHLLSPDDFGIMAIVLIFIGLVFPISDFGLSAAAIQERVLSMIQLSTLFWTNISMGFLCFFLVYISAPIADIFFESKNLHIYVRIAGIVFIFSSLGQLSNALLSKALDFSQINKILIWSHLSSFLFALFLAINNCGVYSLLIAYLIQKLFFSLLCFISGSKYYQPKLIFDFSSITGLFQFGVYRTGATFINYLGANVDKILIGKFIGSYSLGLYSIVWNLVLIPLYKITPIVTNIALPVFSKIKDKKYAINKYYSRAIIFLFIVNFPILLFIAINPSETIQLLLGDDWISAANVLRLLCIVGLLKSLSSPGDSLFLSKGRSDIGFYWNIFWTLCLTFTLVVFLNIEKSIEKVAMAHLILALLFGPIWHYLIYRIGKIEYKSILINLMMLTGFIIPAAILFHLTNYFDSLSHYKTLALELILFVIFYFIYIIILYRDKLKLLKVFIK